VNFVPPEALETGRLRLRRAEQVDAPAIFEYASDPEVTRLMEWRTHTSPNESAGFIEMTEKEWISGAQFTWVITVKPSNFVIGAIRCSRPGHRADIGYVLNRRYWGNGYATEAASRVTEMLFDETAVWRVWATCDVDNLASARVLEKIGMTREGRLRSYGTRPNLGPKPRDAYNYAKVGE
jgi:[ribosomal protein S5]-alanine N-acetyltransferase